MRTIFTLLVLLGLGTGGTYLYRGYFSGDSQAEFRTATVERGDLLVTIGATGTVEPEEMVDVGAQVVGRIRELGLDPRGETDPAFKDKKLDYGSPVHANMLLAQIDDSIYRATRDQAAAALKKDTADLEELKAKRDQTEAEWKRAQKLRDLKLSSISPLFGKDNAQASLPIKGISDADYILAKANYEVAKALVDVGAAAIDQDSATLRQTETNLAYTTIKSPIEGTIIDRRVNIGQTVVSSLNAPSLFLIAKDLHKMQVWASVNEADIGRLKVGMDVAFTVDAFPKDSFRGKIYQIRYNATTTQNVVTYTVVVSNDNADLKLLPFLTADVKFEVDRRPNVLLVPNAALRWQPKPDQISPEVRESLAAASADKSGGKAAAPADPAAGAKKGAAKSRKNKDEVKNVWVKDDDFVRPLRVEVGASDGTSTEVSGPDLTEGLEVVVGELRNDRAVDTKNPFAPRFSRGTVKTPSAGNGQGK